LINQTPTTQGIHSGLSGWWSGFLGLGVLGGKGQGSGGKFSAKGGSASGGQVSGCKSQEVKDKR